MRMRGNNGCNGYGDESCGRKRRAAHRYGFKFGPGRHRQGQGQPWHVAIAGNPNCGKTSFFNGVTNGNHYVGNWPGVTVETVQSRINVSGIPMNLVDLPGTYSLCPDTEDQKIAGRYLVKGDIELIINVVDASNLERNLYLTLQLLELGIPMVVFLNKMDVLKKEGLEIDVLTLSKRLGVPVIPLSSVSHLSIHQAMGQLMKSLPILPTQQVDFPGRRDFKEQISEGVSVLELLAVDHEIVDERYSWIGSVCEKVTERKSKSCSLTDRIDRIVLNRYAGLPIFAFSMLLVFLFSVNVGGLFIDFFDIIGGAIFVDGVRSLLEIIHSPEWFILILSDGVGAGFQTVATFIPVIFFMFMTMAILEDSGFMARTAFTADSFMRYIGLPGNAFVPLLVGFGCTVPAIMATRTLASRRDRYMTIFMTPFMSCGARLPVYAVLSAALFGKFAGLIVFTIYLIGIFAAMFTGLLLKKTVFKNSGSWFVMELPAYHLPRFKNVMRQAGFRLKAFIKKAAVVMVIATAILGILNTVGMKEGKIAFQDLNIDETFLAITGKSVTPIFKPMGLEQDDWPASVALFTGLFAKEAIISTINAIYGQQEASIVNAEDPLVSSEQSEANTILNYFVLLIKDAFGSISDSFMALFRVDSFEEEGAGKYLKERFTPAMGYSYLLFVLLYFPCVAALAASIKEMGWIFSIAMALYSTILAWAVAVAFYQVAEGYSLLWGAVSILVFGGLILSFRLAAFLFPEGKKKTS